MKSKPSVGTQSVMGMGVGGGWGSEVSTIMANQVHKILIAPFFM